MYRMNSEVITIVRERLFIIMWQQKRKLNYPNIKTLAWVSTGNYYTDLSHQQNRQICFIIQEVDSLKKYCISSIRALSFHTALFCDAILINKQSYKSLYSPEFLIILSYSVDSNATIYGMFFRLLYRYLVRYIGIQSSMSWFKFNQPQGSI